MQNMTKDITKVRKPISCMQNIARSSALSSAAVASRQVTHSHVFADDGPYVSGSARPRDDS